LFRNAEKHQFFFVENGAKINAVYYQKILRKHLTHIRALSGKHFTIQQDGARSHTANTTLEFLKNNVPDFIGKDDWPADSPDLNPLDYSVWDALEELVYRSGYLITDVNSLKTAINKSLASIATALDK